MFYENLKREKNPRGLFFYKNHATIETKWGELFRDE